MTDLEHAKRFLFGVVCCIGIFLTLDLRAQCLSPAGDITGDGSATVVDVQCAILSALYDLGGQQGAPPGCIFGGDISRPDLNCDLEVTVVDVQVAISAVLGSKLDVSIDANANNCVDTCEASCAGKPNGAVCDDLDPCTVADSCTNQNCTGQPKNCNDGNLCTTDTCGAGGVCSNKGTQTAANGASYYYLCPNANWSTAQTNCVGLGGHLVTINNAQENDFIDVQTGNGSKGSYWIGYNDLQTEGTFVWASGQPNSFTDFCSGEPNNFNGNQDCVRTNWLCFNGSYRWDDAECAATIPFVCEVTCNDGNACTTDVANADGTCSATPISCSDNNQCTADSCNPASGCVFTPIVCDDANSCTTNGCNPNSGCTFTPVPTEQCTTIFGIEICTPLPPILCDDNNACTVETLCAKSGACQGGSPTNCNDNNGCTLDGCVPSTGCTHSNLAADCCSAKSTTGCGNSACQDCVCGMDGFCCSTSWDTICASEANNQCASVCACGSLGCNDNNACTSGDLCGGGSCVGAPIVCDDGLACTVNGCEPASGCTTITLSADCCVSKSVPGCGNLTCQTCVCSADGFCCSTAWDGLCAGRAQNQCASSCLCAADICDDANGCTANDECQAGNCQGTPVGCDDQNPCTADQCVFACDDGVLSGPSCYMLVHSQIVNFNTAEAECQAWGGHLVTIESAAENSFIANQVNAGCPAPAKTALIGLNDVITEGKYVWTNGDPLTFSSWATGEPNNSGDEDAAHIYTTGFWNDIGVGNTFNCFVCEKAAEASCQHPPAPPGTACPDDGNLCTNNVCDGTGSCKADPVNCDDNNKCTVDSCNPAGGCDGYVNGSSCYRIESPEPGINWTTAENECIAWGGHLVSINSAAENTFLHALADIECPAPFMHSFIGLNDLTTEGVYQWIAGDAVTYLNWNAGEPNNSGNEDVGEMLLASGKWNDLPAAFLRNCLICEKPLSNTTGCVNTATDCDGDCCSLNGSTGCNDTECTECVCKFDPFCCASGWDGLCAACANGTGGVAACQNAGGCDKDCPQCDVCGNGFCGPSENCVQCPGDCGACTGGCCQTKSGIGCDDADCQSCVCALDSFCCNVAWDGACASCASGSSAACDACTLNNCGQCDTCGNGVCLPNQDCCDCAADCPGTCIFGTICL
ncbi:MAG: hypothetical protein HUU55_03830 [Myxococcales bacterium]|nr:hypothetical protein [Myxococcales bacterium]